MGEEAGVLDAGLDLDFGSDVSTETTTATTSAATAEPSGESKPQADDYKDDKAYRTALKAWRDANKDNPEIVKVARRAYELNGRFAELGKLDPKGIDGVRETYALVQSAGGPEKIVEMQQTLADYTASDELFQAGDPKALEALGPEFDKGLAKIAPAYLDRIAKADPEAYAAAILPHLMQNLKGSPLVAALNAMIDDVEAQGVDDKAKLQKVLQRLAFLGSWFNKQEERVGQLKQGAPVDPTKDQFQQERTKFEQEKATHFWNTQINPQVASFEKTEIEKHLAPYVAKLKLPDTAKKDLLQSIRSGITQRFQADKTAFEQYKIYRAAKSPDAQRVISFLNTASAKYIKESVDAAVNARYGHVLASRPGPKAGTGDSRTGATAAPGTKGTKAAPIVVPTKPTNIDWQATKRNGDLYKYIYVLTDGRTVRWNRN